MNVVPDLCVFLNVEIFSQIVEKFEKKEEVVIEKKAEEAKTEDHGEVVAQEVPCSFCYS